MYQMHNSAVVRKFSVEPLDHSHCCWYRRATLVAVEAKFSFLIYYSVGLVHGVLYDIARPLEVVNWGAGYMLLRNDSDDVWHHCRPMCWNPNPDNDVDVEGQGNISLQEHLFNQVIESTNRSDESNQRNRT